MRQTHHVTVWDTDHGDVFILGAGFSRAVSSRLPLTDELGNACLAIDGLGDDRRAPVSGFTGGNFETWLSGLAERQPYLSEHQNLENQALYLRFSDAIAAVLGERVCKALWDPAPRWLQAWLKAAHCRRSTLITFNYDTLIECAVDSGLLFQPGYREPVFWAELIGNVPAWAPGASRLGAEPTPTLRLLKLHGSLNWYWVPGDDSGISMARRVLPGRYGEPAPYNDEERRRELPGRVPFVVPPSATKSAYYRNPIVREVWHRAAEALGAAQSVTIFGYSLPPTDTTFSGMLWQQLKGTLAPIHVADVNAGAVVARLAALGLAAQRLTAESASDSPIAASAAAFCRDTSVTVAAAVRGQGRDSQRDPLVVTWTDDAYGPVERVTAENGLLVLHVDEVAPIGRATRQRPDVVLPTLDDVLRATDERSTWVVRYLGEPEQMVVDWTALGIDVGYGRGRWNMLTPAGPSPDLTTAGSPLP